MIANSLQFGDEGNPRTMFNIGTWSDCLRWIRLAVYGSVDSLPGEITLVGGIQ